MADPVNYPRAGVNADTAAGELAKYSKMVAASRAEVTAGDKQAASAADEYAAALKREQAVSREMATIRGEEARGAAASAEARRASAAAIDAESISLRRQAQILRETTGIRLTPPQLGLLRDAAAPGGATKANPTVSRNLQAAGLVETKSGFTPSGVTPAGREALAAIDQEVAKNRQAAGAIEQRSAAEQKAARTSRESSQATTASAEATSRAISPAQQMARLEEQLAARVAALKAEQGATGAPTPAGGGGGGGRPPTRPPAPPVPPSGGAGGPSDEEARAANRAAQAEQTLGQRRAQSGGQLAMLSQDMRRYGALTSEFFVAASRGEVTLREIGYQTGITIAKFGGWTAAAGLIYGAVGALRELGKGAIDTQSSVATISRFIPNLNKDRATQGLVGVSNELVEPIGKVGEAQAAFARVVKEQEGSLQLARLSVLATKLDNIDLADSYRYLIAIMQEGNFTWRQIPAVFDQISGAQRNMGARVSEVLPALAKSIGAVKAQGGDISQLIAEITTAQITTGQTGNLIGTGFARGAANFYNRPSSVAVEKQYGVDTSLGFTQRLQEAVDIATKAGPKAQQDLAHAFFGPLRGGLLTGLFRQGPKLDDALTQTSQQYTKGSTLEEWQKQAGRADVQIAHMGVSLQNLGAEMARAGLFKPFGYIISGGNQALSVITSLTRAFGDLPGPIRSASTLALGLGLAVAGLRRFSGGELLPRVPVLRAFDQPERRGQQLLVSGLRAGIQPAQNAALAAGMKEQQLSISGEALALQKEASEANLASLRAQGAPLAQIAKAEADLTALQAQITANAEAQMAAAQETVVAKKVVAAREAEVTKVSQLTPLQANLYGETYGLQRRPHVGSPSSDPLVLMRQGGLPDQAARIERLQGLETGATQFGVAAGATSSIGARIGTKVEGAVGRMRSGFSRLGQIAGALGPLDYALIGLFAVPSIISDIDNSISKLEGEVQKIKLPALGRDPAAALRQASQNMKALTNKAKELHDPGLFTSLADSALSGLNAVLPGTPFGEPAHRDEAARKADAALKEQYAYQYVGQQGTGIEKHIQGLRSTQAQIDAYAQAGTALQQTASTFNYNPDAARGAAAAVNAWIARYRTAAARLAASGHNVSQALRDAANVVEPERFDIAVSHLQDTIGLYGLTPDATKQAQRIVRSARISVATNPNDYQTQGRAVKAIQGATGAILDQASKEYQAALTAAGDNPALARAARAKYLSHVSFNLGSLRAAIAAIRASQTATAKEIETKQQQLDALLRDWSIQVNDGIAGALAGVLGKPVTSSDPRTQQAEGLRGQIKNLKSQRGTGSQEISGLQAELKQELSAYNQAAVESQKQVDSASGSSDPTQLVKLRYQIASAHSEGDAVAQARIAREAAQAERAAAKTQEQRLQAELDLATAENQYNQALIDRVSAQSELAQAQLAGDPVAQAARAVSDQAKILSETHGQDARTKAQTELVNRQNSYYQAQQERFSLLNQISQAESANDPVRSAQLMETLAQHEIATARGEGDRLKGELDLANARNTRDKAISDLIQARYTFSESQTQDPVARARIEARAAAAQLNFDKSHGAGQATLLTDRAKLNDARAKVTDTSLSASEDTIQFQLDLGKISTEQAIQEYQGLLKVHGITKELRRQVLERIHQLQTGSQSQFADLNLGTIRLPTPYEIRRGLQAAAQNVSVTNHYDTAIHVDGPAAATAVGTEMDRFHAGTGKAIARAKGRR